MILELCPSPALFPFYQQETDTVVVVDIFRATTTICAMLQNGASAVIPVSHLDEAKQYKSKGYLVGAERNAKKMDFADAGNSPYDYLPQLVNNKEVVFSTTNGTRAIEVAQNCGQLLIGAFSNIDALAQKCVQIGERVVVLCAGWNNQINIEDTMFGGALASKLSEYTDIVFASDSIKIGSYLWQLAKTNPLDFVKNSVHYQRLVRNNAERDATFCLLQNTTQIVPYYDKTSKKITY